MSTEASVQAIELDRLRAVSLNDRTRVVRILGDLHHLAAVHALAQSLETTEGQNVTTDDLLSWVESMFSPMDSMLERLSGQGPFLIGVARTVGDDGFESALEASAGQNGSAVASLRRMAVLEGGVVAMLERRLGTFGNAMVGAREALRTERQLLRSGVPSIRMDWPHLIECAAGVGLVVGGAFAAGCGVTFAMPPALIFGVTEIVLGAGLATDGCPQALATGE